MPLKELPFGTAADYYYRPQKTTSALLGDNQFGAGD
jgi:hypothetical protein